MCFFKDIQKGKKDINVEFRIGYKKSLISREMVFDKNWNDPTENDLRIEKV